jgi:hypothetical protein
LPIAGGGGDLDLGRARIAGLKPPVKFVAFVAPRITRRPHDLLAFLVQPP